MLRILLAMLILASCNNVSKTVKNPAEPTPVDTTAPKEEPVEDSEPITSDPVTSEPSTGKTRIVIISDLNGSYGSTRYGQAVEDSVNAITKLSPSIVLVTGDMVAGQKKGLNYQGMWESFHKSVTTPLTQFNIPIAVTPGNHDASAYKGYENERAIYGQQWKNYQEESLDNLSNFKQLDMTNFPFYYSFLINDLLFISIDATTTSELTGDQRKWLLEQVKTPNVSQKIIFSHMPFHPVAQARENDYIRDSNLSLFKELKSQGVSLILSGHHHAYYPGVYDGVRHISQACLGGGARKLIGNKKTSKQSFTVIDIEDNKVLVDAYSYPRFDTPINRNELPSKIKSPKGGYLQRDDTYFQGDVSLGRL